MIYTAQYRYQGKDRLDITVKGNCIAGKLYAPNWTMVNGIKKGTISEDEYTKLYYELLIKKWSTNSDEILKLVNLIKDRDITLVCFCPANNFCHRYLLVNFLKHNWNVQYGGERKLT